VKAQRYLCWLRLFLTYANRFLVRYPVRVVTHPGGISFLFLLLLPGIILIS